MAASNPFRVSDLIAKYGWKVMPYLGNLGSSLLAEAQVLFVDSGHANALDADDTEHGHSFEKPLATWDYAISLCTADERSIILLAPTHVEALVDTQVDIDIADVATIGIGVGAAKPTVNFGHVNSSIDIGANNVSIQNVNLVPTVTGVLIGIHVETDKTGFRAKDVKFVIGATPGSEEFVKTVELTSGNDDTVFEDVTILASVGATTTHGIHIVAAADRLTFRNVIIDGPFSTGGIVEGATGLNHILEDCAVDTSGTNYSFDGSSTFAKRVNNVDGQVREDDSESLIVEARGSDAFPSGITNESIWAYLLSASATPAASSYDNETDSLEAISDKVTAIGSPSDVTGAVPVSPTDKSLQDILSKADGSNNYSKTTDSLEAIRDYIDGATALDGITLDHLLKTTTTKTLDQDLTVYTADFSVMAHVMSSTAVGSTFKASTDSLEAIAAAIAAITDNVATAVPDTAVARSLQDILNKDDSGGFNDATDSLEAIRDHLDGTTVLGGIQLDHLAQTVSAGTNYPTEVTTDSILGMIMSTNGNPSGFNKTTDSLQAISDFVRTGTTLGAGINLDHLLLTTTSVAADGDLSGFITAESVLAHIMAADADVTTSYNASTDSLEAISVALAAGTGSLLALSTNNLDHLAKVTTGLATDGDLSGHVIAGSILSHIMSADADADDTGFNCSTDSLAAIAAALAAGTGATVAIEADNLHKLVSLADGGGNLYPDSPVDDSILSYIMTKANPADITDFDNATDSLEMISDKVGAFAGTNGAGAGESAKAQLTLLYTDTQAIVADTAAIDPGATRLQTRTFTNWTAIANALWTVSAPVKAKIWGIVLVGVKNVGMNLKISTIPTAPGGVINLVANLDCQNDSAGTLYKMNTTLGGAMVEVTGGATLDDGIEVILPAGTVVMDSDAVEDAGGSIQWFIQYEPIEAGAAVSNT